MRTLSKKGDNGRTISTHQDFFFPPFFMSNQKICINKTPRCCHRCTKCALTKEALTRLTHQDIFSADRIRLRFHPHFPHEVPPKNTEHLLCSMESKHYIRYAPPQRKREKRKKRRWENCLHLSQKKMFAESRKQIVRHLVKNKKQSIEEKRERQKQERGQSKIQHPLY